MGWSDPVAVLLARVKDRDEQIALMLKQSREPYANGYSTASRRHSNEYRWYVDERERLKAHLAEVERERDRLRKSFGHYHVAGTTKGLDIDTCAQCGRDIRDEIHWRSLR
jgi:hypothetical protein